MNTSMMVDAMGVEVGVAAKVFAALADPARLRILAVLADSPRCVCEIQTAMPLAANLLSYHLRSLREAGLIVGTRRGRFIDYRLADAVAALVTGSLRAAGLTAAVEPPPGCTSGCEARGR